MVARRTFFGYVRLLPALFAAHTVLRIIKAGNGVHV